MPSLRGFLRHGGAWVLALATLASLAAAQTRDSASIRGRVVDPSGLAVSKATVVVTNSATGLRRETSTDEQGEYAVAGLPLTGAYNLRVSKTGFSVPEHSNIHLLSGETARIDFRLSVAAGSSTVEVVGTIEGVQAQSPELVTHLDLQTINEMPVLGRKWSALTLLNSSVRPARGTGDLFMNSTLFVVNAGGRRQTTFSLDNSTGDDSWGRQTLFTSVPFAAVQEFSVLTNATSAEYGRTTGGAVNIVTKSGTNNVHGEAALLWRPASLEANMPLSSARTGDKLAQGSGAISGPLVRDRTHYMLALEQTRQERDSVVTSPLAPGLYTGDFHQTLFLARLDHQINAANALMARANFDRFFDTNPSDAVGGITLPSAARVFRRRTYSAEIVETAGFGPAIVNEARLQFQLGSPITDFQPVQPSTQFVAPGAAIQGESRSASLLNHQYQFADTLSMARGRHALKVGTDLIYSRSGGFGQEFGGGFVLGQFTMSSAKPVASYTIADATRFTQSFGNQAYRVGETLWAGFVQDDLTLRRDLTLNLGLRYELQTFTDDRDNFSPRVGFAWKLPGSRATVLRGGYNIFYSELRANLAAGARINGPTGIFSFSAAPGQFGFPTSLAALPVFPAGAVLPPRDIMVLPGERQFLSQFFDVAKLRFYPDQLLNPYTQQWTFGIERELAGNWILTVDYVGQHSIDLDRPVDLNAPAPFTRNAPGQVRSAAAADATRPLVPVPNGYRRIVATINEGAAYYNGLQINLRRRLSRRFSTLLSYTWSHTLNTVEPDAPQQDPNDPNFLGRAELANSLLDQRHRASLSGWYELPGGLTVGALTTLASGRPYNVTTGVDNNGDGSTADRPVINGVVARRNAGQGTPVYDLSPFVEKRFRISERFGATLRAEGFNVLNHSNIVGRNGVWGNLASGAPVASFGLPLGGISNVDPGREFQFLARVSF